MTLDALIAELQKLSAAGYGDKSVEVESNDADTLALSGSVTVENDVVVIGIDYDDATE